ncbi:MAG TPA: hypothetical protein VHP38_14260, partial [Ruminiclostridium sp.]|nr:hypothetical protein [Ruminiclostridium sp.]
ASAISIEEKANYLKLSEFMKATQEAQYKNPDSRILICDNSGYKILGEYAIDSAGVLTGDKERFYKQFWEIILDEDWEYMQTTVPTTTLYGGRKLVIFWQKGQGELYKLAESVKNTNNAVQNWRRGQEVWDKKGIAVSLMGQLAATLYDGVHFDCNVAVVIPNGEDLLSAIWCFCSSDEFSKELRVLDQSIKITNSTLVKVPFDAIYWKEVAAEKYPNGLPKPCSNDATQWLFHGHPVHCELPLQVAVARLLGYQWPAELDKRIELADEARDLMDICEKMQTYIDKDGIVCIPSVRGEATAAERLLNLLAVVYKGQDINKKLSELLANSDHAGKSLESWLRDKFFTQHCKLFEHRPFIWHIWDGLSDGFGALVNYHKLDRKNLETLIYTYLGDWINKQKAEIASGVDGAQEKLAAAENLKKNLELILQGEAPYDIFVRWKPIHAQSIGWEPDINDGVRLNIRPFMSVPDVGKKGAGVLRDKPNIKWDKDRGKDIESSPWFKEFNGDRINDWHLTLEEKKRARDEKRLGDNEGN